MTELNPFSHKDEQNKLSINENFTESASENDYENFSQFECCKNIDSIDSSYPESSKKKYQNYLSKNIYIPELFLERKNIEKYICGLCGNVCDDIVECGCECGKYFCKKCLVICYDKELKCPICRADTKGEIIEAQTSHPVVSDPHVCAIADCSICFRSYSS